MIVAAVQARVTGGTVARYWSGVERMAIEVNFADKIRVSVSDFELSDPMYHQSTRR